MFYILHGEDDFSVWQALEEIKSGLDEPEMLAANTARLNGQSLPLNELRNNCNTVPFMSQYRLVIVDGLLKRFEVVPGKSQSGKRRSKSGASTGIGEWSGLPTVVGQMPDSTVLVIVDGQIENTNPLLKMALPTARVKVFQRMKGDRLAGWIRQQVAKQGGNITPQAVGLLCELVGGNLWAMHNEVSKLVLHAQGQSITEGEVGELSSYAHEANVFVLVDTVLEGQRAKAQESLYRLRQEGDSAGHILAMIARQFRLMALAHESTSGPSRRQVRGELAALPDYALHRTIQQASSYDPERLRQAFHKLAQTDMAIKTGRWDEQLALELLVADLCDPQGEASQPQRVHVGRAKPT